MLHVQMLLLVRVRDVGAAITRPSLAKAYGSCFPAFEDFDDNLAAALANTGLLGPVLRVDSVRIIDPRTRTAFASRSLDLEHLSVSHLSNAEDFFGACLQTWTWAAPVVTHWP